LDPEQLRENQLFRGLVKLAAIGFGSFTLGFYGALFLWIRKTFFRAEAWEPYWLWTTSFSLGAMGVAIVVMATFALRLALSQQESRIEGSLSSSSLGISAFVMVYLRFLVPRLRNLDPEKLRENGLYRGLVKLAAAGFVLFATGLYGLLSLWISKVSIRAEAWGPPWLWIGFFSLFATGAVILTMAVSALKLVLSQFEARVDTAPDQDKIEDRHLESVRLRRERKQEELFRRNLEATFVLQSCLLRGVKFFDDFRYSFQPRVNVLLGKNGFGKTVLLRTLAALIQSDAERSGQLFSSQETTSLEQTKSGPCIKLEVTRDGKAEETIRDALYFQENVGKIPLLAISDSRLVNRAKPTVGASATGHESLSHSGARHFLTQEPYEDVVQELLAQLGIEHLEGKGKKFGQPIFRLIESVVRELTGDDEFGFYEIKRSGQTGFRILVKSTGSRGEALPIQSASQGTLSIVAIFGLIYSFLRSIDPDVRESEVTSRPGIVIIDEIDAHLHPSWQQKIIRMLRERFPNVQFVVTGHSPAIVAGCEWGEVSVLRRNKETRRFYVETLERDFVGATSRELYDLIFEIDDIDRTYLEYATKSTMSGGEDREQEIAALAKKEKLTAQEERRKDQLEREVRLIERAGEVREERLKHEQNRGDATNLEELQAENLRLKQALEKRSERQA